MAQRRGVSADTPHGILVGVHDVSPGEGSRWCVVSTIPGSGH
jgi:hypothetical protein